MAPVRVAADTSPWPLHDVAATRRLEQAALAAAAPMALMQQAGTAVARLATALAPHAQRIQLWAGGGNNGGDALVAALCLHAVGREVAVTLVGDAARLPADAATALRMAAAAGVSIGAAPHFPAPDFTVDGLLGIGARGAPQGALLEAIDSINASAAPVLAIDVPSGLDADSGRLLGGTAVRARATLSLLTLKPGCFNAEGRDHAGDIWLETLGLAGAEPTAWLSGASAPRMRAHATHKGRYGDVAVIGGAEGMVGAALLAARAALAAGAGRVLCSLLDGGGGTPFDAVQPGLMGRRAWWLSPPPVLAATTAVCGCGGGAAVAAVLPPLLGHAARLVLDADALNAVAADSALRSLLQRRAARGLHTLLTPHPLEAARLLKCTTADVQQQRLHAARALADELQCGVLLKGSGSVVTAPGAVPHINPTGNAKLASAGTGDVLAGWAGGMWAQQPEAAARTIGSAAAWQHGRAADRWPHAVLRAADLVEALAALPSAPA